MKYAWASITKSCTNFGNFLIEYNLFKLLEQHGASKPSIVFDAFKNQDDNEIKKIGELPVIIPGCTTLTTRFYPGIKDVASQVVGPVYNLGAAFGVQADEESLNFAKYYAKPIGTRDPISDQALKGHGYKTEFIGCPTLFSGTATSFDHKDNKNITFGFGVKKIDEQTEFMDRIIDEGYQAKVIIQVNDHEKLVDEKPVDKINYEPEGVIQTVSNSRLVVTGRLHVALPALACGTPVLFVRTINDTRFSLLEYLGVPMTSPEELANLDLEQYIKMISERENDIYSKISDLRKKYSDYLDNLPIFER